MDEKIIVRYIQQIRVDIYDNCYHDLKRRRSFDLLDRYLDSCCQGVCHKINNEDHYYLIDISLEGYIKDRAYYYSKDGIGVDDNDRYYMAINRLSRVFSCQGRTSIDPYIFAEDTRQVQWQFNEQVKKRKAFWVHMSNNSNNSICNYCNSCNFIEEQEKRKNDSESYRQLILTNQNKANAIDLFRLCHIRRR